jgi:hypothetical protein
MVRSAQFFERGLASRRMDHVEQNVQAYYRLRSNTRLLPPLKCSMARTTAPAVSDTVDFFVTITW